MNWNTMNNEQKRVHVERQVQAIAVRLMAEDVGLDKFQALAQARIVWGRPKRGYPKVVNND